MAKVQGPAQSLTAVGSVGGLTFDYGRGGMIVKSRPKPLASFTAKAEFQRGSLRAINTLWHSLDAATLQQWAAFAQSNPVRDKFQSKRLLTGFNWFVKTNTRRAMMGLTLTTTLPGSRPIAFVKSAFWNYAQGQGKFDIAATYHGSPLLTDLVECWSTRPMESGSKWFDRNRLYFASVNTALDANVQIPAPSSSNAYGVALFVTSAGMRQSLPFYFIIDLMSP